MTRDFTLEAYSELVCALKENYNVMSVADYLTMPKGDAPIVVLRHDVDKYPERAERMASLEKKLGVRSTYYFRWDPKLPGRTDVHKWEKGNFPKRNILQIAKYGHEVGYHYENYSELKDKAKALADFIVKLGWVRQFSPCVTVAMHGAPRSKVRNADMLTGVDLSAYGLLGEPHISPAFSDIVYVSDSGRMWSSGAGSVRDTLGKPIDGVLKGTYALIDLVHTRKYQRLMLNVYPSQWAEGNMGGLMDRVMLPAKSEPMEMTGVTAEMIKTLEASA